SKAAVAPRAQPGAGRTPVLYRLRGRTARPGSDRSFRTSHVPGGDCLDRPAKPESRGETGASDCGVARTWVRRLGHTRFSSDRIILDGGRSARAPGRGRPAPLRL